MEKRFKPLKQISLEEAEGYVSVEEDLNNNFICYYTIKSFNDDDWDNITYYTARSKKSIPDVGEGKEIIYIMSNISIPGLLKIGYTGKLPEKRRIELSKANTRKPADHPLTREEFDVKSISSLKEFLDRNKHTWVLHEHHTNQNGLTILKRKNGTYEL